MKRGGAGDIDRQLIHEDLKDTGGVLAPKLRQTAVPSELLEDTVVGNGLANHEVQLF